METYSTDGGIHSITPTVGDSMTDFRTQPRSHGQMVKDWVWSHRRWLIALFGAFVALQLILDLVIATHLYVYQFEIYGPDAFQNVSWWALVIDTGVWTAILLMLFRDVRGDDT